MIKVLPSSNPEKEEKLLEYAKSLEILGVEYLHCDVMDGEFVENKCLPISVIENVRNNSNILLDIHLMIKNPAKKIKGYLKLKPNIITIHFESVKSIHELKRISNLVRSKDVMFGVSIKPNTPVTSLVEIMDYVDLILIMSVEPGKSGQKFLQGALERIRDTKILIGNRDVILEVDGGVCLDNYVQVIQAGADFLVMGSAFYNSNNKAQLLNTIDSHYKLNKK